ncbi:MAG: tetratricopeptide repeat protein [Saprospiraceae bacterium]
MKRKLFFLVVLALMVNLTALIINMVSDQAEIFCAKYLGEHYIAILTILFIILLLVSVFLADWEKLFGKKEDTNKNQSTEKPASSPTDVSEIIPEEKVSLPEKNYYEIIDKIKKNEFQKAIQLLQNVPAFENQAVRLSGRFDLFNQQKREGRINIDQETITLNTLRADMLSMIEPFKPLKDYKEEVEAKGFQKTTYGYKINGTDDRRLNCPQNFLGRDKDLEDILKVLENPKTLAVQIKGEAGIGKTDFCKQAIRKYLKKHAKRNAFWVEVEFIGDTLALLSAIGQLLGLSDIAKKEQVFAAIENSQGIFVLDNLETLEKDKNIVRLLDELKNINNTLWISTTRTQLGTWNVFPIKQLEIEDATQLFIEQWRKSSGEELTKDQEGLKDFIQKDLGCHPLSIILTASRGADLFSLDEVTKAWKNGSKIITQRYAGKRGHRLDDSDYSLELSFGSLQDHPNAVRLWALCCFFPEGVSVQDLEYFAENKIASAEDRAILLQRSILRKENGKLDMLPPFKRFAIAKIKENKKSIEQQVFEDGMGFAMEYMPEDYIQKHPILLNRLPFIFQFLEYFSSKVLQYPKLLDLADKMMNLFIFKPFLSKEIIEKIIRADLKSDSFKNLKPQFQYNLGQLEFRIGNNDSARQLWESASGLYEKTGSDLGKANCQMNFGQLEFQLGNKEKAKAFFNNALQLFEKINYSYGISYVKEELEKL